MPEIIVDDDAQKYIKSVDFDMDSYCHYLKDDRKLDQADIDKISIIFTDKEISKLAYANASPDFLNEGKHVIRFSPTRLPRDIQFQGRLLRHETEHVIQGCSWQYKAWAASQLTFVGASAIGSATVSANQIYEASEAIPEPARILLSTAGALGCLALGYYYSASIGKIVSPGEFSARRAERKYADCLVDGTLVVNF